MQTPYPGLILRNSKSKIFWFEFPEFNLSMHKTAYGWLVGSNPKLILDYLDWVA